MALLTTAQTCFDNLDYLCAIDNVNKLLILSPNHPQAMSLILESKELLKQEEITKSNNLILFKSNISKAQDCFNKNNFLCAQQEAEFALKIKPENTEASELYQNAVYSQNNLERADKILADGQACLKKLNFSCAIAKSESALEFVPNYKKALQLKRDATESLEQVKKKIKIE